MVHIGMLIYSYCVDIIVCCLKSDGKLEVNIMFCISASRRTSRARWSVSSRSNCEDTKSFSPFNHCGVQTCKRVRRGYMGLCLGMCVRWKRQRMYEAPPRWVILSWPVNNVGRGDPRLLRPCSWCSTVTGWMKTMKTSDSSLSKE